MTVVFIGTLTSRDQPMREDNVGYRLAMFKVCEGSRYGWAERWKGNLD